LKEVLINDFLFFAKKDGSERSEVYQDIMGNNAVYGDALQPYQKKFKSWGTWKITVK
jgi:hypothetical protein